MVGNGWWEWVVGVGGGYVRVDGCVCVGVCVWVYGDGRRATSMSSMSIMSMSSIRTTSSMISLL